MVLGSRLVPLALSALPLFLALTGCAGGMRFQAMNMEQPGGDLGLPPPVDPDYHACYAGRAEGLDTNEDGRPDVIRVRDESGRDVCHGSDSNHDGKIDQWDVMDTRGKLAKRARDTNNDGLADERWSFNPAMQQCALLEKDTNGDGHLEAPVDICAPPKAASPDSTPATPTPTPTTTAPLPPAR